MSLEAYTPGPVNPSDCTHIGTRAPRYDAGVRLLLLHRGLCSDALVEQWRGSSHGSRHVLRLVDVDSRGAVVSAVIKTGAVVERDLNEFDHCIQRLGSAAAYEGARSSYCVAIVSEQCHVEDAITGNVLRIEDQLIHVSAADVSGVTLNRPEW